MKSKTLKSTTLLFGLAVQPHSTDSEILKPDEIFVANRLAKISDVSPADTWNYIASKDNPADDGSRGYSVEQMCNHSRWISGSPFLQQPINFWPSQDVLMDKNPSVKMFTEDTFESADKIKAAGIDEIVAMSVNDPFVIAAFASKLS